MTFSLLSAYSVKTNESRDTEQDMGAVQRCIRQESNEGINHYRLESSLDFPFPFSSNQTCIFRYSLPTFV